MGDTELIKFILDNIYERCGGKDKLLKEIPILIRRAIDEVIDTERTGRLTLDEIEKTEKTYLGTKIEILFRNLLKFPKGKLDLDICGQDVDIKNTCGSAWMIPREAINKPCILFLENENKYTYRFGIVIARPEYLSTSQNQDKKRSISKGSSYITWVAYDDPYPYNKNAYRTENLIKRA